MTFGLIVLACLLLLAVVFAGVRAKISAKPVVPKLFK
jgi:hypothetical protein